MAICRIPSNWRFTFVFVLVIHEKNEKEKEIMKNV